MKKITALFLFIMFMSTAAVFAEPVGEDASRQAHRAEMKEIKKAQKERKAQVKNEPASKWNNFWQKEAERSGLADKKNGAGKFFSNLNPVPFFKQQSEQFEARKAAARK